MNIERVWGRAFRSYEEFDVALPQGVTAIIGQNGAGKSSLVTAIEVALFGERSLSRYVSRVTEGLDMEVGVEFTRADGQRYRVRRGYSLKGAGKSYLVAESSDGSEWLSRTKETAAETQRWLEGLIGVTRETFRASAFLAQGDGAAFTEAQPRDRKDILVDVLGLEVWTLLLARLVPMRIAQEHGVADVALRIRDLEEVAAGREDAERSLADAKTVDAEMTAQVAECERVRDEVAVRAASVAEQKERVAAAQREAVRAEQAVGLVEQKMADVREKVARLSAEILDHGEGAKLYEQIEQHRAERDRLRGLVEQRADHAALTRELEGCVRGLAEAMEHLTALQRRDVALHEEPEQVCESCGQVLTDTAREQVIAQNEREREAEQVSITEFQERKAEILGALPEVPEGGWPDVSLIEAAEAIVQRALAGNVDAAMATLKAGQVVEANREWEALAEQQPVVADAYVAAQEALVAAREAVAQADAQDVLDAATAALHRARVEATRVAQVVAVREQALTGAVEAAWKLDSERLAAEDGRAELETLRRLEKAFGRDGVPAMVVEHIAVPQIETEANRILAELGAEMTVELRTQRATKTGEIRDALDIVVTDPTGEAAYEDFSGGERTRLNLALRIALARLLASRRGAQVRILVVDEPEFLDDAGMDRLSVVLRGLSEFDRALVVSHHEVLRDAFDQIIAVTKVEGKSRVAGGGGLVAVPVA